VLSLLYYWKIASPETKRRIRDVVRKSLEFQQSIDSEVANPFDYARQLTQDKDGNRHTGFFFPHDTEVAPWWQGENARLASLATAARLAAKTQEQWLPHAAWYILAVSARDEPPKPQP
jgi:hypothetical protein